ncbi:hypothetical protein Mal52_27840 [Symmachiella dynata]|uniref:Uncharacterized protein n=1 Tax=Symmachiella dynata TaxID=2527995 RepID=A0A517ZPA0_9PLAN|nr:hypothetical protein [Symmachiella dynata]QDU44305.1 hypothetical protein Mal52_27840 [Symmachiella dynata]
MKNNESLRTIDTVITRIETLERKAYLYRLATCLLCVGLFLLVSLGAAMNVLGPVKATSFVLVGADGNTLAEFGAVDNEVGLFFMDADGARSGALRRAADGSSRFEADDFVVIDSKGKNPVAKLGRNGSDEPGLWIQQDSQVLNCIRQRKDGTVYFKANDYYIANNKGSTIAQLGTGVLDTPGLWFGSGDNEYTCVYQGKDGLVTMRASRFLAAPSNKYHLAMLGIDGNEGSLWVKRTPRPSRPNESSEQGNGRPVREKGNATIGGASKGKTRNNDAPRTFAPQKQ